MKFFLLGLLLALPAKADIVFFDLNFSPMEIAAVTATAKARGEAARIFPERTAEQQRELDKYYRLTHSLQGKLNSCKEAAKCEELSRQLNEASARLQAAAEKLRRVQDGELENIFSRLDREGVKISTLIFSGHSGGTGQVGGLLGGIVVEQVRGAFDKYPRLLEPVRAMLLWGCYSGTLHSLNGIWQKNFPSVSTWGGFENRSPLGIRESSGRFLKSFLLSENKLRAAKSLPEAHRVFRSLDLVAELDGTAVVRDMYFTYDEAALVSEMLKRCDSFNAAAMETFLCFDEGKPGCENPPADHRGPLRDLYNFLQKNRHCRAALAEKFPQIPSLEYLIRLIYLDNVKGNFAAHHREESPAYSRVTEAAGIPSPRLEAFGRSSRAEDAKAFGAITEAFMRAGYRDFSVIDRSDWRDIILANLATSSLNAILGPSWLKTFDQSCVPFSWVDPGSREKDSCRLSEFLRQPLPAIYEQEITASWAYISVDRYVWDQVIEPFWSPVPADGGQWKKEMADRLQTMIKALEGVSDRTPLEELRLDGAKSKLASLDILPISAVAAEERRRLGDLNALLEEKIEWAKGQPFGSSAKEIFEYRKSLVNQRITELERFIRGRF